LDSCPEAAEAVRVFRVNRYSPPRIVQRSRLETFLILLFAGGIVLGLMSWQAFEYGRLKGGYDRLATLREHAAMNMRLGELEKERDDLRGQVARLERTSQIDLIAAGTVREEIEGIQEERFRLEEELAFYRSIVAPEDGGEGLRIQRFSLTQGAEDREYSYEFTLSQSLQNSADADGSVGVVVSGVRDGKPVSLALNELSEQDDKTLRFHFKHYQVMQGSVRLPEGFSPESLTVEAKPGGKKLPSVSETFDWLPKG